MSLLINVLLGLPLLLWGRKLFWLFVGAVGFITGFGLAQRYLPGTEQTTHLLIGAALGLVGLLLALFVQRFAITVTGFLAGLYVTITLLGNTSLDAGSWIWIFYLGGGVAGSLLVMALFDWALIILSSLVGSALISQASLQMIQLESAARTGVFIVLLIIGLVMQFQQKQRE